MSEFKKRVFGCVIVKSVNSNYNADFSKQPRTLPNGTVYATDKALKYLIKFFIKQNYADKKIMYFKQLNSENVPLTLEESYIKLFESIPQMTIKKPKKGKSDKEEEKNVIDKLSMLSNILSCIDVRLFGATFAMKSKNENVNISVHGPVQICHGVNRYPENIIYSEQILSPFRNDKEEKAGSKGEEEKVAQASTLGSQFKLLEGHYVHHFSINPCNLKSHFENLKNNKKIDDKSEVLLSEDDIRIFKEAISKCVTYFDSSSKAGTENELLLWIELPENDKRIIPNLTEYININRNGDKVVIDLRKVDELLKSMGLTAECIYYNNNDNLSILKDKDKSSITLEFLSESIKCNDELKEKSEDKNSETKENTDK